jgi:AAA15 family ATPase/GTPase
MIDSIDIRKYRNLDELRINSLARVNLIIGKNNAGKSTLLEAIALFVTKCDLGILLQLLKERGEIYDQIPNNINVTETNIKTLSSLFSNRKVGFGQTDAITIGTVENTLFGEQRNPETSITLRFVKYIEEHNDLEEFEITSKRTVIENENANRLVDYKLGLEIRTGENPYILTLETGRLFRKYRNIRSHGRTENFLFISTRNIDREINGQLWDKITLTEKEQVVIEALKIIEPLAERIAFIEESGKRSAVIKLSDSNNIFPLLSMGDGINRIFTIILALVNSDNGYLLIDEFENGLHHSVQEKLWKIIFNLSSKLNIQVFVTTHSEDCISGFENILNSPNNNLDGKLIRLDNINGKIKEVEFNKEELKIATDQDIEIR